MRSVLFIFVLLLGFLSIGRVETCAQATAAFNQRDDTYRVLGLKRAKESFEVARAEYDRQKTLHERGLITTTQLERARQQFSDAEVNYQQSLLAVLFEQQYITIVSAVKSYDASGTRRVTLTVANTSGGSAEFRKLVNLDDELFRSLQPDIINDVYISLYNEQGSIISQPYEYKIDELRYGQPAQAKFTLMQDVDAVTVGLIYSNGSQRTMKIYLQKDATVNKVRVQSEQFSQEIDLGKSATFDLGLELFSGTANTFSLEVLNLPHEISRGFKDAAGSARLSQVKFAELSNSKRASLEVTLPDRPTQSVLIDQAIPFFAVVIPPEKLKEFEVMRGRVVTEDELRAMDIGYARLELIPRGKGELLVRSNQLFYSVETGGSVQMAIDLINEGSHRLDNVEIKLDMPNNWRSEVNPQLIGALAISQEVPVTLKVTPPEDIVPGKYEFRIRTSGTSNSQPVLGEDKTVTVEVIAEANLFGTLSLVLLILGLVTVTVVFGVRLAKK